MGCGGERFRIGRGDAWGRDGWIGIRIRIRVWRCEGRDAKCVGPGSEIGGAVRGLWRV